ncbi:MAG: histidine kinase, partial [Bacteroidales bacterium]
AILIGYNFLLYGITAYVAEVNNPFHLERFTWTKLSVICLVELVIMCLMMLNHSARFTIKLYRETEELKQYQSIAEFKALQYQLNPHFLFNSLNTLLSEIEYDPANAKLFTTRLAEVYRYILQTQEKRTVPVSEELEFLKAYIYLHQVRLGAG